MQTSHTLKLLRVSVLIALTTALTTLSGCASQSASGSVYREGEARRTQYVEQGVVESVRQITIEGNTNHVGTAAGAVVGGVAGSSLGKGKGNTIGAVLGAVAGGLAGQALEKNATTRPGLEITVKMDRGGLRAYVQDADESFRPGDRVRIVQSGGTSRVSH